MKNVIISTLLAYSILTSLSMGHCDISDTKAELQECKEFTMELIYESVSNITMVDQSAYQALAPQTDDTPDITASGYRIKSPEYAKKERIIAVSRDLREQYPYGTKVAYVCECPYEGIYTVHDTMASKYKNRIDILVGFNDNPRSYSGYIIKI